MGKKESTCFKNQLLNSLLNGNCSDCGMDWKKRFVHNIIHLVDGDVIVHADPDVGYVHRGEEKIPEFRFFIQDVLHGEY